ncbi:MAG: hypothetical protein JSV32_02850, partial [Dehalococcoidia bacterium]
CAVSVTFTGNKVKDARVCLNAIYNTPWISKEAKAAILGNEITTVTAGVAGKAAIENLPQGKLKTLKCNAYKSSIVKEVVKEAILDCKK